MDSLTREWALFLDRCLQSRIRADLFGRAATQLHAKLPISGRRLAALLLRPRSAGTTSIDPRVIIYCEQLLALKRIDAADALAAAFQHSRDRPAPAAEEVSAQKDPSRWTNPPELEEIIFNRLHKAFSSGERPVSGTEGVQTVVIVSKWMSAMVSSHTSDSMIQAMAGFEQHPQQQSIIIRESLGLLVAGLMDNPRVLALLRKEQAKDVRKAFSQALSSFVPFLSQTSLQIAQRLELSQKEHDLHDKSLANINGEAAENAGLEIAALQLDAVMDLPVVNTRAGLYVFLNASLVSRPLADDYTIVNYLHARYKTDAQAMVTDLIIAAFDILANAMYRGESNQSMFALKCFLINRIPVLLTQLSSSMASIYPMSAELCITQAISRLDSNAFPSFSQGFGDVMGNNSSLSDVRLDFLNACALHGLILPSSIERLLGEAPMQGPPATKYKKTDLLAQYRANFETVNTHIEELDALNGNTGAIAGAITEFISHLCETQMTMYLRTICNSLSKRPQALDAMLQFSSPSDLLRPLCQFLDEWRYEDAQVECQPVYDEFGAVLVLVLAFIHRFDLSYHELGISQESFVAQLLERGHQSISQDQLTEGQGNHLGSWLKGLFDSDREALGNDVFASCRPQEFYLIVPTLFSQIVIACSADVLTLDTVKGGLEYLQNTSLLPSLVGGLTWMASYALKQTNARELEVVMQIFHKLIRSAPTSGDAHALHSTILSIVSSSLEKCFRTLSRRHPSRTDIEPLLTVLGNNTNHKGSVCPAVKELEQWANGTTLNVALRRTLQQLSQWAAAGAIQPHPPSYTHKQIYACTKILGVYQTLHTILEEIKVQSEAGNGASALDVGVSLICAVTIDNNPLSLNGTNTAPPRTRINFREMLQTEFDNAARFYASDPLLAETIVRLHRRVEAQLLAFSQAGTTTQLDLPDVAMDVQNQNAELNKALNDAAATMAATGGELQPEQQELQRSLDQHLDLTVSAAGLGLSAIGVGAAGADMGTLPNLDLDMGDLGMDIDNEDADWGLDFSGM